MDTKCCIACGSPKIAYICTDCAGPKLHLCKDCYKGHGSAGHSVIEINEYQKNPSKYLLAEERDCKKHQGQQLKLFCAPCNVLLCVMCPHDSSVICEKSPGGKGKHETGSLKTAVESQKKIIDDSLGSARNNEADVLAAINRCKQKKDEALAQHNRVKDQAECHERKVISAVKAKTKSIIEMSARNLEMANAKVDSSIEDMQHFLENLRGTRKEAEGLKSSSADVTVHRLTSSLIDRLTTPFPFPEPNIPVLKLETPIWLNEADEVEKLMGSLVSYSKGDLLNKETWEVGPFECCVITTTKGPERVTVWGYFGLFLTVPGEVTQQISADGVGHWSVCMSPDEKIIYSTTFENTICMYTVEDDSLNLVREITVKGAQRLFSIRASPTTGNLAVLDRETCRITLHDRDLRFLKSIQNVLQGSNPFTLEWSPSGDHLFITDHGKDRVNRSVLKLKVEPAEIIWRKSIDYEPALIRHIGGRLYISHWISPRVTAMSAEDGAIIKIITVTGAVQEMREIPHADVGIVFN